MVNLNKKTPKTSGWGIWELSRVYSQTAPLLSSKSITGGNRKEAAWQQNCRSGMVMNGLKEGPWGRKGYSRLLQRGVGKGYRAGGWDHVKFLFKATICQPSLQFLRYSWTFFVRSVSFLKMFRQKRVSHLRTWAAWPVELGCMQSSLKLYLSSIACGQVLYSVRTSIVYRVDRYSIKFGHV